MPATGYAGDIVVAGPANCGIRQLSYQEREQEYPRTQEIAEAAHFLGRDGLIVPSARSNCTNVIVFCEPAEPNAFDVINDRGLVGWERWRTETLGY